MVVLVMSQQLSRGALRCHTLFIVLALMCMNTASAENLGQRVYEKYCTPCHGENGDANTAASRALNPMPRNFIQADFVNDLTRERVIEVVSNGRPGTAMVGWQKRLSREQIEAVSGYVRQRFAKNMVMPKCASCHSEKEDFALGEQVYHARCYFCHGYDGRANTEASQYLSPPPKDLRKVKMSQANLAKVISQGREGTAMMPFRTVLSQREIAAVVAYVTEGFSGNVVNKIDFYHSENNGWSVSYDPALLDADKPKACLSCHQAKQPKPKLVWQSSVNSDSD